MPDCAPEHPAENSMTTEISPEAAAAQGEIRHLLEAAIDALPQAQRTVFMLRTVEEFSTEDTAACLGIPPETVKTRLHRAKQHLRPRLQHRVATALTDPFPFPVPPFDPLVATLLARLDPSPPAQHPQTPPLRFSRPRHVTRAPATL